MLNDILKALLDNGFKVIVFAILMALSSPRPRLPEANNKIIGAMVALLSDAAKKAQEEN